ncbi:5-methylcytosine-specific restriction endonuclease system specificity protein McrC [Psychrobacter sp. Ps1]|uniref:5-methylcytosine-specific restriction endonuclease system specificity protein McrC n=1 Tax=Psychrobacter sp. Ps1 TaxID=2790955 RepID=UPI001EDE1FE2|nr:5-methylcytosine-specific restriction endonuclease system specificity protein McrC [Psychrobacter sp. Ps1]MCG3841908.1 5-methylcytosine-specific restriction endonuclease system specificity protein McrC [Psychrobacter sp. Ps1]
MMDNQSSASDKNNRYIDGIPIRNLWVLILYASDSYKELGIDHVAVEDNPEDIPDLIAQILCKRVKQRIQQNLSYGYQTQFNVLDRVRGRIDLLNTERHMLLERGKVACYFDELNVDTPRNRYVRAALKRIAKIVKNTKIAKKCRLLDMQLKHMGVSRVHVAHHKVPTERFGNHDIRDKPMVIAARLAFDIAFPTEDEGTIQLYQPNRAKKEWLRLLFQNGIAGLYEFTLPKESWKVTKGKEKKWQFITKKLDNDVHFPSMKTDIIIDNIRTKHRIVIDTKFSKITKIRSYPDREYNSLNSENIYQIYAYLRSQESDGKETSINNNATGLLLYPLTDRDINSYVVIQGHKIQFATVDLRLGVKEIKERLLHLVH